MNTHGVLKNNSNGLGMLMLGMQVDGLRKHPNGRVDQLEDRYLGMVEAPSSNLGTSTSTLFIADFFVNFMTLRSEQFVHPLRRPPIPFTHQTHC